MIKLCEITKLLRLFSYPELRFESADTYVSVMFWGCCLAAMIVGTLFGAMNGVLITRFKVPPFIATLGVMTICRGLTMLYTGDSPSLTLAMDLSSWAQDGCWASLCLFGWQSL